MLYNSKTSREIFEFIFSNNKQKKSPVKILLIAMAGNSNSNFLFTFSIFFLIIIVIPVPIKARFESWRLSTPLEQGLDELILTELTKEINENYPNLSSIVIIRNGYLVMEEYFGINIDYSCTKTIISILFGIAINKGFIANEFEPVLKYFPDRTFANLDDRKRNLTIYHLLTMTTGLSWAELSVGYESDDNSLFKMWNSSDWIQYVLDQEISDPGATFNYNTGASHVLSAILQKVTDMSTFDFAQQTLFGPLGIQLAKSDWPTDNQGINRGGEGLKLTPRSLAKIGQLYLANGTWDDTEIVSKSWVVKSTQNYNPQTQIYGYGYQWWTHPEKGVYSAWGYAQQRVIILPNYQLVSVFTGFMPNVFGDPMNDLVNNYIVPSVIENNISFSLYDKTTSRTTPTNISISSYYLLGITMIIIALIRRKRTNNET